jgi:hypothetical protein
MEKACPFLESKTYKTAKSEMKKYYCVARGLNDVLDGKTVRSVCQKSGKCSMREFTEKRLGLKDIEWCAFERKCINFNDEFNCPSCGKLLVPVCVNLGMIGEKFYCGRNFPEDCSKYGCPKYNFVYWRELENYRLTGSFKIELKEG